MPGHRLDGEDIDAGGEQTGDVAASEVVGGDPVEPGFPLALLEDVVDRLAAKPRRADLAGAAHRTEERAGLIASGLDPLPHQLAGAPSQEHPPVVPALACPHGEHTLGRVEVVEVETAKLRPAQAGGVEDRDHRRVSPAGGRRVRRADFEERPDLVSLDPAPGWERPRPDVRDVGRPTVGLGVHQAQPPAGLEDTAKDGQHLVHRRRGVAADELGPHPGGVAVAELVPGERQWSPPPRIEAIVSSECWTAQ